MSNFIVSYAPSRAIVDLSGCIYSGNLKTTTYKLDLSVNCVVVEIWADLRWHHWAKIWWRAAYFDDLPNPYAPLVVLRSIETGSQWGLAAWFFILSPRTGYRVTNTTPMDSSWYDWWLKALHSSLRSRIEFIYGKLAKMRYWVIFNNF